MAHTESLEHYFKLGQEDYVKGFHEPFGSFVSYLGLTTDKEQEINETYRKGWDKDVLAPIPESSYNSLKVLSYHTIPCNQILIAPTILINC